ncbi:hypothetical protein [uncultured Tateyamaria sp.]|uniref:hypothetical protein n=1 Tax=uncultured Tateyamaria sp. TaxID=455651 RepID=UPI002630EEA3|nr:hypothetical protein [uncultured Tateyamaria sp.]
MSDGQDGSYGVCAQCYDAAGEAFGIEFWVNGHTAGYQISQSMTALASGGFVVSWRSDGQDGDGRGIYLQR